MEASLKEHRGRVSDIKINKSDTHAVSASFDCSCIIWDIKNHNRIRVLFESTMFRAVVYHPDESQVLTTGSDRKITYWDCFDGQAIRMLDGSSDGEINALAILNEGEHYISGGEDKTVKSGTTMKEFNTTRVSDILEPFQRSPFHLTRTTS